MKKAIILVLTALLSLSASAMDIRIRSNPILLDYLPNDIRPVDVRLANKSKVMLACGNTDGRAGRCVGFCSDSQYGCWFIRFLQSGTADRVYMVNGDTIQPWLQMDPNNSYKVIFASENARRSLADITKANLKESVGPRPEGCASYSGAERTRCDRIGPQAMRVATNKK